MLRNLSHSFCVLKNRKKSTSGEIFSANMTHSVDNETKQFHCQMVSFSSCQPNLIKTFQIEAMITLITKMALLFF